MGLTTIGQRIARVTFLTAIGVALTAGVAAADYTPLRGCQASAGGFTYKAEGTNTFNYPTSSTRRWTQLTGVAYEGTSMGGNSTINFSLTTGSTVPVNKLISGLDKNQWGVVNTSVTVSRASYQYVKHNYDIDAVLAYRAKCSVGWTYTS